MPLLFLVVNVLNAEHRRQRLSLVGHGLQLSRIACVAVSLLAALDVDMILA